MLLDKKLKGLANYANKTLCGLLKDTTKFKDLCRHPYMDDAFYSEF